MTYTNETRRRKRAITDQYPSHTTVPTNGTYLRMAPVLTKYAMRRTITLWVLTSRQREDSGEVIIETPHCLENVRLAYKWHIMVDVINTSVAIIKPTADMYDICNEIVSL